MWQIIMSTYYKLETQFKHVYKLIVELLLKMSQLWISIPLIYYTCTCIYGFVFCLLVCYLQLPMQ